MSLNIKPTKIFGEVRKQSSSSKVKSPDENKVEFEDVLKKEKDGKKENPHPLFSEEGNDSKGSNRSQSAINSYKKANDKNQRNSKLLHARDVFSFPVRTIDPKATIREALELMNEYKIHHLPVVDKNEILVGIISDRDVVTSRPNDRVERLMKKNVVTAKETAEVSHLAREMIKNGVGCLPILNREEHLIGIVTKTDLLECLARTMPLDQYV